MAANARRNRVARSKADRRTLATLLPGQADRALHQPARALHAYRVDDGVLIVLFDQDPTGDINDVSKVVANGGTGDPNIPAGWEYGPPMTLQLEGDGWVTAATSVTISPAAGITFVNGAHLAGPVTLPIEANPYT